MRSIAHRIYRNTALITLLALLVMFVSTAWVSEDLESTMLHVELAQERDFIVEQVRDNPSFMQRETPGLTAVFIPGDSPAGSVQGTPALPEVFQSLNVPFSGEITQADDTYLVSVQEVAGGTLYLARNITHFEHREWLFRLALLVVVGLVGLLAALLSIREARRVVRPLQALADGILHTDAGPAMKRLPDDWTDAELQSIAGSFNEFVGQLEAYVKREKSLLGMASHELRTPLAVISGALDVLEERNGLTPADRATVARIRRSTTEMQSNVKILLTLARRESTSTVVHEPVDIATEIGRVLDDLAVDFPVKARVQWQTLEPARVQGDATMIRMLLRNLVQNALQHTPQRVHITLSADAIEIRDEGSGLSHEARKVLTGLQPAPGEPGTSQGLGFYLVTLMVERLHWRLDITDSNAQGTVLNVRFTRNVSAPEFQFVIDH